jgi:hypothetical protein
MKSVELKAVISAEDKASQKIQKIGSAIKKVGIAFAAGSAAVYGMAKVVGSLIEEYATQERAETRLMGALKNVRSARNQDISALTEQASALQKVTRFGDENIVSAQGILATYQLNQEAIGKLTPGLLDMAEGMARATGEMPDLESMAKLVAKAMGGEDIESFAGALTRANIAVTNHQKELLATGDPQQKMNVMLEIMKQNVGGLAEIMGQTTSGKMARFKSAIGEMKEDFGRALYKGLEPFLDGLIKWGQSDETKIGISALIEGFKTLFKEIGKCLGLLSPDSGEMTNAKAGVSDLDILLWTVVGTIEGIGNAFKEISGFITFYGEKIGNVWWNFFIVPLSTIKTSIDILTGKISFLQGGMSIMAVVSNSCWSGIYNWIAKVINHVSIFIGKIGSMWNAFTNSTVHIKLPHFEISWIRAGGLAQKVWEVLGFAGMKPSLSVNWYGKGGIFNQPSIIGVGEKGPEAVVPLDGGSLGNITVNINGGYYLDRHAAEEMGNLIIEKLSKNIGLSAIMP